LWKDSDVVIEWTIVKVEGDPGCNAIAMDDLGDIASGDGDSLNSFEGKEAVGGTLGMAHWNQLPVQGSSDRDVEDCTQANRHGAPATGESVHESLFSFAQRQVDIANPDVIRLFEV
jgi:hypothetical protein